MKRPPVDPRTMTDDEVVEAIQRHGERMGSRQYYIDGEIDRWRRRPVCLVAFHDPDDGLKRAYCRLNWDDPP